MHLIYLANIRLPTEKAHGLQIMKTCEALAKQGVEVELIVPRRLNRFKDDPFEFYGVEKIFKLTKLWCLDLISLNIFGALGFWLESWTFYQSAKRYLFHLTQGGREEIVYYTRDLPIACWLSKKMISVYYEIHMLPDQPDRYHRETWQRAKGLVVISNGLKQKLLLEGVAVNKIIVAFDAVDTDQFTQPNSQQTQWASREQLSLPQDKKIVLYTGHLYEWKGAHVLADAAEELYRKMKNDIQVYIVGGTAKNILAFKKKYHNCLNLHIVGWEKHSLMPFWHHAADVLILPTSARETIGSVYTSPLKLFEYMISERPIVASDIPSLHEVLDDNTTTFCTPDDPKALANAIQDVLTNFTQAQVKAKRAHTIVLEKYSWNKRAKIIRNFISKV